jgi:hypothetical protein
MLTLFLTRTTLLKEIEFTGGGGRPNLLLFDIQDDQIDLACERRPPPKKRRCSCRRRS